MPEAYIVDAVRTLRREGLAAVEVTEDAAAAFNADLQRRMQPTVWHTGGCSSWYLDEHGNNTTLWPRSTFTFKRLLARFDRDAYHLTPGARPAVVETVSATAPARSVARLPTPLGRPAFLNLRSGPI